MKLTFARSEKWIQLLLAAVLLPISTLNAQSLKYPEAQRDAIVDDFNGTRVADPYRWLEQLESARTLNWLTAERRLASDYLSKLPDREVIRRKLTFQWNYARTEVPWREGGRIFYLRNTGLQPQSVLYMQASATSPPRVALDPNIISSDGSIGVRDYTASPDGRFLVYNTSLGGSDVVDAHIRELSTGRELNDIVKGVLTNVTWTNDGQGFFYVRGAAREPGEQRKGLLPDKQVAYHLLGQSQAQDQLVVELTDARWVYCMVSEDGRYALFVAEKGSESEVYAMQLGEPKKPDLTRAVFQLNVDRRGFQTPVDIVSDTLFLRTTFQSPRESIVALDLRDGSNAKPRVIVAEAKDVIESATIAGDRLVVHYLVDVKSHLRLFNLSGKPDGEVALPGIGAVGWPLSGRPSSHELFYSFVSFLTPATVYRYDLRSGRSVAFNPPRVQFDPRAFETKQIFYTSKDGTHVPMFVTSKKNLKLDGTHPTFLTAYGGYGSNLTPDYNPDVPMWLEMGGIYAVANIRGGGEYGESWHRNGMLGKKQNSFDDFISAAEFLISTGYTSPENLAIYGHSNGGLLIGAVITQRPDLFAVAIPNAGHYDMLRFHRFTAGANWISEYGSPDKPEDFPFLRAYSPLHNVRPDTCYPATMLLAADQDDRVVPSHSYKFAATLQASQQCTRPIVLRVAVNSSHGYESRQSQIDERTDMWSFITSVINMTPARN